MTRRRRLALLIAVPGLLAALPADALAHGLVGRQDLPIPPEFFVVGAAIVLAVSFAGLAVLWPRPRFEQPSEHRVAAIPRLADPLCGAIGIGLFALVVYAGFAGSQTATNNLTPTFVFVLFWVGLVVASVLLGDVFAAFNPWRALARAVAWVASKVSRGGLPEPLLYPERLGRWPAAAAILGFAWVELVYSGRTDPSNLAVLGLVYAAVQLVGMSLYGIEAWNRYGDGFGVYFGLFARISPLRWERGALVLRRPLSGLSTLVAVPGTGALLCTMIGSTAFDGFSSGPAWGNIAPDLTQRFVNVGFSQATALELAFTVGLAGGVLFVSALYRLGVAGMRGAAGEGHSTSELAARFAHSLVPIALAYVVAHYFSLLVYQGQATLYLASDPLGTGADLFGTAGAAIDYSWITATGIWYVQVAALVAGHVAGLVLAHDRALVTFRHGRAATRSQYWMLTIMIAFTSLALWLLSKANA